jgi:hypothetical protein
MAMQAKHRRADAAYRKIHLGLLIAGLLPYLCAAWACGYAALQWLREAGK